MGTGPYVSPSGRLSFDALNAALKAAGEETRLRVLALLAEAELTVSDLTDILRQSQPRISRHLKLLAEAGLVERFREGTWAFFRLAEHGGGAEVARALIERLNPADQTIARDRARLASVRQARPRRAGLFPRTRRRMGPHPQTARDGRGGRGGDPRGARRQAVPLAFRSRHRHRPHARIVRPGNRTRARARSLARHALLARDRLERAGLKNCSVRQGDIYDLPLGNDSFDVVILHQVLHFLDDGARAINEAARVLRPGGRLLVVDFAPHEQEFLREQFAHRRLGFAPETVTQWITASGLSR